MSVFRILLCSAATFPGIAHAEDAAPPPPGEAAIVVTGRLESTARQEQAAAPNLINIQPAETIAKYPDVNAAEALGRVSGVALSIDTGEGRFVNIRGLDGNLNGATLGGVVLLNTQPGGTYFNGSGRAVEFDTVPIGAIDRISVIKTGLPDHDAEGLGGTVELTPRTAIGVRKPFAEITLGGGYEPLHSSALYRDEVVIGAPFGHNADGDALFSAVATQFLYNDSRGIDDVEAAYLNDQPATPDKAYDALELRHYNYHRRRYGYSGEFDFTPSSDHRIYARVSIAGYNEHVYRNRLEIDGLGGVTVDPAKANGFIVAPTATSDGASTVKTLRDEDESHRNTVFQIGGEHHFGGVKLDWFGAYSRATYDKHYDYNSTFAGPTGLTIAYDNTTDPNYPAYNVVAGQDINASGNYVLDGIKNQTEHDRDREWSGAVNLSFSPHLTDDDEIKVGGKLRYRHKTANPYNQASTASGDALTGLQGDGPYTFYDDHYAIGYGIDGNKLRALFAQGAQAAVLNAGGSFDDNENIAAGYAQYRGSFGGLGVLAGVRVEHTAVTYRGIATTVDADGNETLTPQGQHRTYTNVFPTVQLRYDIMPKLVARATYSTGIARPGFYQTIQSANVDIGAQSVAIGNPALKPTTGQNFDASLEYYLPANGIVSLGFFDKEFRNYIVARTTRGAYQNLGGIFTIDSYQNVSGAHVRGLEAAFVDRFPGLPGLLDGLGIDSNFSYVSSSVAVREGEKIALPGTFKYTGNAALFYEHGPIKLRLAGQYESKALFGVGGSRATDIFQDKRFTLDLNGGYHATSHVELYANVKNLTNAPLRFYEGSANRPIQRELYDVTIEGGVKVHL